MVNPNVDSYAESLNHKNDNLLKTKQILKPKYHLRFLSGFHI